MFQVVLVGTANDDILWFHRALRLCFYVNVCSVLRA
jgi:hypothetical protein